MTLQFVTNAAVLSLFYEIMKELPEKYQDERSRVAVLKYLIEQGYKISVIKTDRTPDQIARDAVKHYGKVGYFKISGDENETK